MERDSVMNDDDGDDDTDDAPVRPAMYVLIKPEKYII